MDKITYCNVCGNELSTNDRFCNICGAVINDSVQSQSYIAENPVDEYISEDSSPAYPDDNVGYTSLDNSGYVPPDNVGYALPDYAEYTSPKKHKRVIAGIVVLVCLLAAGLGTWYFISHRDKDDSTDVKKVEVVFDLDILVKDDVDLADVKVTAEKDDEVVELEINGNKAVAQLEPGEWKIKAEAPNYEPIIQEIEVLEEVSDDSSEIQELEVSFDFTEQPMVQSTAADDNMEAAADELWRQAYIDYLEDNNILNIHTVPMDMSFIPTQDNYWGGDVNEDDIGKIDIHSLFLYDYDSDGIMELYYLWGFSAVNYSTRYEDNGEVFYSLDNTYLVVTRYSYDGEKINTDSVIFPYYTDFYDVVEDTGDNDLIEFVSTYFFDIQDFGIKLYCGNEDGSCSNTAQVKYYIANYGKEPIAEINDTVGWRQAYIDYIKVLDMTDTSLYIEDDRFDWANDENYEVIYGPGFELALVDHDNNGIPELCLRKTWIGNDKELYQYEFVEYKEDGTADIKHTAIMIDDNSVEKSFVTILGDIELLENSFYTAVYGYYYQVEWYTLIKYASEYYYAEPITDTSELNPDAITYIENYGK